MQDQGYTAPENDLQENDQMDSTTSTSSQEITIEQLQAMITVKEQELNDLQDKLLRSQADYSNLKQRTERDKIELISYANEKFAKGLIGIVDILSQGLTHTPEDLKNTPWVLGIFQFEKSLKKFLEEQGITSITITPGETIFDPLLHEALSIGEEGTEIIAEVYQEGYLYHQKTLRPAKVKVA